ncbi:MAG: hypothetical protein HY537_00420 [Deltaproteobacteria bacterium]|nr:hypothetical protein [Deltaproteobacteria bacterium]
MKLLAITVLLCLGEAFGSTARSLYLSDKKTETIRIVPGRSTILSFPSRPTKVILGNQGLFAIQYVENDIAIAAIKAPAHSNLFVYLEGRRFGFDLVTVSQQGDEIILVRDSDDRKIKVRVQNE